MKLALLLPPFPDRKWALARQIGIRHAITKIPQKPAGEMPDMDFLSVLHVKQRFEDAGFHLMALEGDQFPMQRIKLGLPGRDEDIERFCQLLRYMGATGIPILCYNFMAQIGWLRTSATTPGRGGSMLKTLRINRNKIMLWLRAKDILLFSAIPSGMELCKVVRVYAAMKNISPKC